MDFEEFDSIIDKCIKRARNASEEDIVRMTNIYDEFVTSSCNNAIQFSWTIDDSSNDKKLNSYFLKESHIKFGFINTKTELSKKHTKNSNDVYCSLMKDEGNTKIREFEENAYLTENNYINCGKGTNELLKAS